MKLVILDRDGVINYNSKARILTPEQWEPLPGSLEAIVKLKTAGYTVVIATNQSIISKKKITIEGLQAIHNKMQQLLNQHNVAIDKIFVCPHQDSDNCECRKPKPGMLKLVAKEYGIDFNKQTIPFVGDAHIDLLAAVAAGALPILVKTGKGLKTIEQVSDMKNLLIFDDLSAFVNGWL